MDRIAFEWSPGQGGPRPSARSAPLLGAVVIARNEAKNIGACLESVLAALKGYADARVVLVDSDSTDDTVAVARRYPVSIYRYRAPLFTPAAGRRIGFEQLDSRYVLFVDGDCRIDAGWVRLALDLMERAPRAAVAYGSRVECHEGEAAGEADPQDYDLGGNALYRAGVLREVGSFNPFVVAEEEGELLGRIRVAGYTAIRTPERMIVHHTVPKQSLRGFFRRFNRGFSRGWGQVLRLSIGQGLFGYHARRFNRYLMTLAYLVLGVLALGAGALLREPALPLAWAGVGVLGFLALCLRRRSLRSALYIASDWVFVAVTMLGPFARRPRPVASFSPSIERIQ